jgi:general stress protein 26
MAHEEDHGKTPAELRERAWDLMKKVQFALFTTWDGARMKSWPLTANPDPDADEICFLVSRDKGQYDHLQAFPDVVLGFADPKGSNYVTVNGRAELSNDRDKIGELWSPFAKAWWDSPDDPDIRVLTVRPERAEIWDGPNKLVAAAVMLTAAATGAKPPVGDHGTVRM